MTKKRAPCQTVRRCRHGVHAALLGVRAALLAGVPLPAAALAQAPAGAPANLPAAPPQAAPSSSYGITPAPAAAPTPGSSGAGPTNGVAAPATPANAVQVLLDQANFWRLQNDPAQAQRALDRLLAQDPRNPDALALQAQIDAERGDRTAAQAALAKLRQVRPDDPRISATEQAIRLGQIDSAGLAEARRLAQEGRNAVAIERYRRLFHNAEPPDNLATEYYQVLSGTEGGWQQARDGLARLVARDPKNTSAQLAYGELLTFRDATRADGISRLAALAANPATAEAATKSWRQALQWLPPDSASIPALEAYLARHPDDGAVSARLAEARTPPRAPADEASRQRSQGFDALNAGRLQDAETAFQGSLDRNANDADALGGMGLVRLRQGRSAEAADLLTRAIAADPAHSDRWESALAGATVGQDYAQARSLVQHGQLEAAEQQVHSIIAKGGDTTGATAMLADIQARRGELAAAEASWRTVLSRQPSNRAALAGLASVLHREGHAAEATTLLERAGISTSARAPVHQQSDELREQAKLASDPVSKVALLRSASAANPMDPWLRLDLARALVAAGERQEARQEMDSLVEVPHPSADALQAAAYFAAEDNRPADAAALAARLPPGARNPQMQAILSRGQLDSDIRSATALAGTSPVATRQRLLALAAHPDPDGSRGSAIARAFLRQGDATGARDAIGIAQQATHNQSPAARLAYASVMLEGGQDADAQAMINSLEGASGLTPEQQTALQQLRAGAAVRSADQLSKAGRAADAYDQLAPVLARSPDNPDANMALARIYGTANQPDKALAINQTLLARDPVNAQVRRAAVDAAIQGRHWELAESLVKGGLALTPNDPSAVLAAADLAQARGDNRRALQYLQNARSLRQQQLGVDERGAQIAILNPSIAARAASPPSDNPFRRADASAADDTAAAIPETPGGTSATGAGDQMTSEINKSINSVRDELAPKLQGGVDLRSRSGTSGLGQLFDGATPLETDVSPGGFGQMRLVATPTYLSAGQLTGAGLSQAQFGSAALNISNGRFIQPEAQTAQGVALDASYKYRWLTADVGSSPLGFLISNVVGGIELAPELADNVRLRVVTERRAVTDSLLSFGGTRDPYSGITWGGVTTTRGHGQLEFGVGKGYAYAGGGYDSLTGRNVKSNTEIEFGAGGAYPVYKTTSDEVRVGLDLVYFGYNSNLSYFSLGQGGYFSPQSYFAALIPVSYTQTLEDLTWSVGGAIGYQSYTQKASPVFPNNAELQGQLDALAAGTPGLVSFYPGKTASGITGGASGKIEYRATPSLRLGAKAQFQSTGDWNQLDATIYARYIFNGAD